MNLKEKLLSKVFKETEFDAILEDHAIGNENIYRLYFVDYHRIGKTYGIDGIGRINWPCKPFMFPKGMTREEGFKVLSYLTDYIEKRDDIEACSLKSVRILDGVLDLDRFGFTRVSEDDENKIINLFTVSGRLLLFKRSELYQKYFEWYKEGITLKEVIKIYDKYNMVFKDFKWVDNQNDTDYSRTLKPNKIKK